jgi:hypothetical protein
MKGHPIRGFFAGLLLGICLDLDLALGGVVKIDSAALSIVLVVSIVVCFILGLWAPIGRYSRKKKQAAPRPVATPLPPPTAWPEFAPTEGSNAPSPQTWNAPPEAKPPTLPPTEPPAPPKPEASPGSQPPI